MTAEVDAGVTEFTRAELNEWLATYGITDGHWRRVEFKVRQDGPDTGEVFMLVERHVRGDDGRIVGAMNTTTQELEPLVEVLAFRVQGMP